MAFSHQIIAPAASQGLPEIPSGCSSATLQSSGGGIYYRRDASPIDNADADEPSLVLASGATVVLTGRLQDVRIREQSAGSGAKLRVQYESHEIS